MENLSKREIDYSMAKARVKQLKNFYVSLVFFAIFFAAYALRKYYLTGEIVFINRQNFSIIFWVWAIILAVKGAQLFFFNQNWENKILNKQLNQNNNGKF